MQVRSLLTFFSDFKDILIFALNPVLAFCLISGICGVENILHKISVELN